MDIIELMQINTNKPIYESRKLEYPMPGGQTEIEVIDGYECEKVYIFSEELYFRSFEPTSILNYLKEVKQRLEQTIQEFEARHVEERLNKPTLYEEMYSTPKGAASLEAARASNRVVRLFELIFNYSVSEDYSNDLIKVVATALDIEEDRVKEVLNGDGNHHIATIAKIMSVMGYRLVLDIKKIGDDEF